MNIFPFLTLRHSGPSSPAAAQISAARFRLGGWTMLFHGLVFFPILLLLASCAKVTHKEDPIFDAVRAQVKALNQRDAAGAIAMMHPEAPGLDRTRETTKQVTETYDLIYMIQDLTLESADGEEAKVRFTQITQRVSGPEFRNNRVVGIHTLRKSQGAWKIYYTQVLKIDYLEN